MRAAGVFLGLVVAWTGVTWPQASHMTDAVGGHVDALFSVWRLAWIDAAARDPQFELWDPPIFFPAEKAFAYSDAVLLPGAAGMALKAFGLGPVAVYNVILALAMVGAGFAMAALVRRLTGSWLAGLVAGVVFALNPHQAEHLEHLEIQTSLWMPALFLCWHRAADKGSSVWAFAATLCLAGQWLSGMYFCLFLFAMLPCLLLTWSWFPAEARRRVLVGAGAGLVVSLAVVAATTRPYLQARAVVGERTPEETLRYSAVPSDFLTVPARNAVYGSLLPVAKGERALFPGLVALLLAGVGLVAAPPRLRWLHVAVALVALEFTFGLNGLVMPWLRELVSPLRSIRAPARAATLLMVPFAVFAGIGMAALLARLPSRRRALVALLGVLALTAEYRMLPNLWAVPPPDPKSARDLTRASVVAEFPMPRPERLDASFDANYMVERIGLWPRLVNGSSGAYPPQYLMLVQQVRNFPDDASISALRHFGVTHVTVHQEFLGTRYIELLASILSSQPNLVRVDTYGYGSGEVTVFALLDPRKDDGK